MEDPAADDLDRFVAAQRGVYEQVLDELRAARKTSHWMWFVFPQLRGLGRSETARRFGIASIDEARRYAAHPLLGPRLVECSRIVAAAPPGRSARDIFGAIDEIKLRSSMTLFELADPLQPVYAQVLERFFAGGRDRATLALLGAPPGERAAR